MQRWWSLVFAIFLAGCNMSGGVTNSPTTLVPALPATLALVDTAIIELSETSASSRPAASLVQTEAQTTQTTIPQSPTTTQDLSQASTSPSTISALAPITLANLAQLTPIVEIQFSLWDLVMDTAWSPNGEYLAVSAGDKVHLYSAQDWEPMRSFETGALTHSLAFSPDGLWLAAGSRDGFLRVWNVPESLAATTAEIQPALALDAHKNGATSVVFSPDSRQIASGGNDAFARFWEIPAGELLGEVVGGTFAVPSIAFMPDGTTLAMVNGDVIRLRDVNSERIVGTLMADTVFYSVAISPDGSLLAAGDSDNRIRLWDPESAYRTGQEEYPLPLELIGHSGKTGSYQALIWQVTFSPDGSFLASAGGDSTVRIWNPLDGALWMTLIGHEGGATCVAFQPGGLRLATGGLDGALRIWAVRH